MCVSIHIYIYREYIYIYICACKLLHIVYCDVERLGYPLKSLPHPRLEDAEARHEVGV